MAISGPMRQYRVRDCGSQQSGAVRLHDFFDYWAGERPAAEFAVACGRSLTCAEAAEMRNRGWPAAS
jgi:hypothetical protein